MKHNVSLLLYSLLVCTLLSCHKEGQTVSLYISMPSSYDVNLDHTHALSVWANGIENNKFIYKGTDAEGRLRYESKQAMKHSLTGNVFVLYPYCADAHFDGENATLPTISLQAPTTQSIFAGITTVTEGGNSLVSLRALTTKTQFIFNNLPKGTTVNAVTLRLVPQAGTSSNLFHTEANYTIASSKMSFSDIYQRTALTAYSTENILDGNSLYIGFFPENYSNCTLQAEIIVHDNTATGTLHVFTFEGRSFARAQVYTYILDFAQAHDTYAAYTTDTNGYMSGGIPVVTDNATFAPVNLGYDEVLSPFGKLFLQGNVTTGFVYTEPTPASAHINDLGTNTIVSIPNGWRLPTEKEMQALTTTAHSEGYTKGMTYGWWFGATATDSPAHGNNVYLEAAGYINNNKQATQRLSEGRYWTDTDNTVLMISDNGGSLTTAEGCACSIRLVKQ